MNGTRKPLVTPETARAMQIFHPIPGLCDGCMYGLGLLVDNGYEGMARGDPDATYMIGHGAHQ